MSNKEKTESVSVGAMLPVTEPSGVMSKQLSGADVDAEFDALDFRDKNPIDNTDIEGEDFMDTSESDMSECGEKTEAPSQIDILSKELGLDPLYESGKDFCIFDEPFTESDEAFVESKDGNHDGIDEDIKPVIDKLNEKGYITKYSCSGHPSARFKKDVYKDGVLNGKLYSTARIVFAETYVFDSIPNGWVERILDNEKSAIYVKAPDFKIINGLPEKQFENWKSRYMNSLRKWVDELPEAKKPDAGEKVADPKVKEESADTFVESVIDEIMVTLKF